MNRIGSYEVVRELGEGGMGRTLLARARDGRPVALKVPVVDDPQLFARMRDEARLGRAVRHPHIIETLDSFDHNGRPVLVVSFVEGASLRDIADGGPMDASAVSHVGHQVASALHAMHTARDAQGRGLQIVHRDVSPGNILVDVLGDAFVIDLGMARWDLAKSSSTDAGVLLGTFRFLAPELLDGDEHSPRSDAWALCAVLAGLSLGRPLFAGSPREVLVKVAQYTGPQGLPLDEIEGPLGAVLRRGLALAPLERPDAGMLAQLLAPLVQGGDARARLARRVKDVLRSQKPKDGARGR